MVLIVSLFYYLYKVEKSIQNYNSNHDYVVSLELIDKQLNDFSITMNSFSNYDKINYATLQFKKNLAILQKNLLAQYPTNQEMQKQLERVKKNFIKKTDNIEYFKSLNSSLISGSHFLFDLQRTIAQEKQIPPKAKSLINEALFYILRFTTSDYIDKAYVENKLQEVKKLSLKINQPFIEIFTNNQPLCLRHSLHSKTVL